MAEGPNGHVQDVEVEREADDRLLSLSNTEQAIWALSNLINARGFHVDRKFAEAARQIAKAAAPEINAEIAKITEGAITSIAQIAKLVEWLKLQGCAPTKLDRKAIEKLLKDDELAAPARRVLELRLGGAQAAVKKLDALLARAGDDDRVRGAFRYHGASTGRWAGEGFQPQNLKRRVVKDIDAAITAVSTGTCACEAVVSAAARHRWRSQPFDDNRREQSRVDGRRSQFDRKPRAGMGCR
jgi:hypothetical protein